MPQQLQVLRLAERCVRARRKRLKSTCLWWENLPRSRNAFLMICYPNQAEGARENGKEIYSKDLGSHDTGYMSISNPGILNFRFDDEWIYKIKLSVLLFGKITFMIFGNWMLSKK